MKTAIIERKNLGSQLLKGQFWLNTSENPMWY